MLKPMQFINNLLEEASGNEEYGSLIKLILPKNIFLKAGLKIANLEDALVMKENSYFIEYFDENNNIRYTLIVYRNELKEVTGYDISLVDNNNYTITYYSSTSINDSQNKKFRFTRVGYDKMYTISFKLIKGLNKNKKFLCEERYYDSKSTAEIADLYSESEALDLAEECSLESEGHNIFTLDPNLKTVIDYFECITINLSSDDFWSKRLLN